jgi:hypothetical protein
MKRTPVFLFFISIFCLLFLFSCGKVDKTEDIQPSEGIPEASQEFTEQAVGEKLAAEAVIQGIVTFASGVVTIERDGDWEILDVEDLVGLDDRVKTDSESYCELQFEEFGIMRIQENTEITVSEIYLKEDENRVNVKLDGGKLLCKVKKLSKGEEFQVKTSTALAGVRGTEFMVDAKEDQSVRVAVKEGEVSVVPTEIAEKLEQIKGELKTETAKEVMEEITFSEIIVTEDREMELAPQDTEEALREFEAVTEVIEKKMKKIDDKAFTLEERQKAIDEANEPVSEKERQVIQKLEGDIEVLKKDVITVTEVESSLVQDGLQKSVEIKESTQIELQEIEKMETKPILIASKSETVKERVEDTDEKGPALTKVSVQVTPEDGKLTINNKESGRGKISGLFMPETKLSIKAEREGYITEEQEITVLEQTLQYIKIELVPEPISWKQKVSDSPFVRGVEIAGNKIVSADAEGNVHCISMTG